MATYRGGGLDQARCAAEAAVAFPRLLRRFPQIAPAGPALGRDTVLLRGFDTLTVTVR